MLTIRQQKLDVVTLAVFLFFIACAAYMAIAWGLMPWSFVALTVGAVLVYWALKWDVTLLVWIWVFSYGLLDWPEWREKLQFAGFFNLSAPRLIFLAVLFVFGMYVIFHRTRLRFDRALHWAMLALLVICALSASAAGWQAQTIEKQSAPYFRFIGALLLPFIVFLIVYNTTRSEKQIRWTLIVLGVYGWFALYTSFVQYAALSGVGGARAFLWPAYINNPEFGIHFDRARGAFGGGSTQAVFLIMLFFANLYVLPTVRGLYRPLLILQILLCPPAIFFTGIRSAYVGFILCGVVWCLWGSRRAGKTKLAAWALMLLVGVSMFWGNLTQTNRLAGGVAQRGPVYARLTLLAQTWEMFRRRPVFGVGFGHFPDEQQLVPRDPHSLAGLSTGVLSEHNLFLNMAAETGFVGLVATIVVFWLVFRQSRQLYHKLPETAQGLLSRPFVVLFWVALVNFLTDAMFRDTLWDVFANGMFWTLGGLVVAYNRLLDLHPTGIPADHIGVPV